MTFSEVSFVLNSVQGSEIMPSSEKEELIFLWEDAASVCVRK